MTHTLSHMLALAILTAPQPPQDTPPPAPPATAAVPSGNTLVAQAAQQLLRHNTFQSRMRQQIELFGQSLAGTGSYMHKASPRGLLLRMEWKLPVGDQTATIQQVSDGRFLWMRRDLPQTSLLSRVDLQQVRGTLEQSGRTRVADGGLNSLAFGGLPQLLQNLSDSFDFQPARAAQLSDMPVWVVQGTWKAEQLQRSTGGDQPDSSRPPATLPAHLPNQVQLVIGQRDLIPYRIEYLRREPPPVPPAGETQQTPRRLAAIELLEPRSDQPLDDQLFLFEPGQQEVVDHTQLYLQSLGAAAEPGIPSRPGAFQPSGAR